VKIPRKLIEKELDVKDVEILNRLTDPAFFGEFEGVIVQKLAKECGISVKKVEGRIKALKDKGVINNFSAVVDQLKVWDNMIFTFVKVSLSPPLIEESMVEKYPTGWVEIGKVLEEFIKNDDTAKKILREEYTLIGTEWDLLIITSTNDLNEHREMFERLTRKGFISMARSMFPIEGAPYIYRPISCPPVEEVKRALEEIKKRLEKD